MKVSKSVDMFFELADSLREETMSCIKIEGLPHIVDTHLDDTFYMFSEFAFYQWLEEKRYDDLIVYLVYSYERFGGEKLWKLVLNDMRRDGEIMRAGKLLDGLYLGRKDEVEIKARNYRENPDNHFSRANLAIARGEAMKVLYQHAYLLENKPKEQKDQSAIIIVRDRMDHVMSV